MTLSPTFTDFWEANIYGQGQHLNRYPYDFLVTFVYRNAPRSKSRSETSILEVGCGAGNNLWFAAREGFQVAGIDGSASAIAYARERFAQDELTADLRVGDFTCLPFADSQFDLALDRCALVCCGLTAGAQAVAEIHRTLRPGGKFLFNPYSDRHSSAASGRPGPDGLTLDVTEGTVAGVGPLCFYGRRDIQRLFATGWQIRSMQHLEWTEEQTPQQLTHAEWRVVVEKV